MKHSLWTALFRVPGRGRSKPRASKTFRPSLEALEDMVLPSAVIMTPMHELASHPSAKSQAASGISGMTPAEIRQAYGINGITFDNGTVAGDGTGETIALVDAYDDPSIASDLSVFDSEFGLKAPASFTKVGISAGDTASTTKFPTANAGWAGEIELDVEWAHAVAPGANILLVEANSASTTDLMNAVNYARNYSGVVAVSMSWGTSEFSGETSYDSDFTTPAGHVGVTFFASSGDSGSPSIWPALSTHVVGAGGSTLNITGSGTYSSETAWSGSGGSLSTQETEPTYQQGLTIHNGASVISAGNKRAGPDVSYDADPNTGFAVYGTEGWGGWAQVGGTSDAAPQWAGLMAIADQGRALSGEASMDGYTQTLPALYKLPSTDFHDVTSGSNGGYSAGAGFDLVTGRGTPMANLVVGGLVGGSSTSPSKPPTIASAAKVVSQTANSATLNVLGADAAGASSLTYTWTVTGTDASSVTFSVNGTNAAQTTTATFAGAGSYTFLVTVTDPSGLTVTSQVSVAVTQKLTSVSVTPGSVTVAPGGTQQFSASGLDQFGNAMATQPAFTWSLSSTSAGSISSTGLFTAGSSATGSVVVKAVTGSLSSTATVTFGSASTVLFQDNFANGAGNWTVTDGYRDFYLVNANGSNRILVENNGDVSRVVAGSSSWTNYSYQATLNVNSRTSGSVSLLARVQDNTHLYFFGYNVALGEWMIALRDGSTVTILATSAPYHLVFGQDYTVKANLSGSSLSLYVGGVLEVSATDSTYSSGKIGFTATNGIGELGNVVVTSITSAQVKSQATSSTGASNSTGWWQTYYGVWQSYYASMGSYYTSTAMQNWLNAYYSRWDY